MPRRAAQGRRMTHGRLGRMQTRWPRGAQYSSHDKKPPRRPFGLPRGFAVLRFWYGARCFLAARPAPGSALCPRGAAACGRKWARGGGRRLARRAAGASVYFYFRLGAGTQGLPGAALWRAPFFRPGGGMPRPARPQLSQRMTIFISVRAQARSARPARRRGGHLSFGRARVCRALCGCSFCGG